MQHGYKQHAWGHFSGMLATAAQPMKKQLETISDFAFFARAYILLHIGVTMKNGDPHRKHVFQRN